MAGAYYRSGHAARRWGTTPHIVRRLCEAGLVEAELSHGDQWRIPASEVQRIEREGLPEIPAATLPQDNGDPEPEPPEDDLRQHELLAPPSATVVGSAEDVVVAENRLKRLKLERETEETRDWFREREREETEAEARRNGAELSRQASEQARWLRSKWFDELTATALGTLPDDTPPEVRLDFLERLPTVLARSGPETSMVVVTQLVAAALQQALRPWLESRETSKAIEEACNILPFGARSFGSPTIWQRRASELASAALRKLPSNSTYQQKLLTATSAVAPVASDFEYSELRRRICEQTSLWGLSPQYRDEARVAIRAALEALPLGTSETALRRASEKAIAPFEEKSRQQERLSEQERRVQKALSHIGTYLDELYFADETGFADLSEVMGFGDRIRERIRKALLKKMKQGDLNDEELEALVEELVEDELD
jgi:hypothetical protein